MSYLPFFGFFQKLLLTMLNLVKVERLELYKQRYQDIPRLDSRFQLTRLEQIYQSSIKKFNRQRARLNTVASLSLPTQTITLSTSADRLRNVLMQEWIYEVLSLFTLDKFLDLLLLFHFEQKILFVCENSHILTHMIYLFIEYLYRPFIFSFSSVYIIPQEQLLDAPFPFVYGLLKKRQYVQANGLVKRYPCTYVFISRTGVNIVYSESKKQLLKLRPEKLKADLAPMFANMEKSRK